MKKPRRQFEDFPLASLDTLYVKLDRGPSKDFMKRSAQTLNIEEKEPDTEKVQQHGLLIKTHNDFQIKSGFSYISRQ